jgi:probable phosphoglycerate mutase
VRRRRQAEQQDAGVWITEPRHASPPVLLLAERGALLVRDALAPRHEPGAGAARADVQVHARQCVHPSDSTSRVDSFEVEMPRTKPATAPPQSTLVLLVRHGQTPTTGKVLPGRAPGLHLADEGLQQARRAAERIAELTTVDAIYASPLERARETAAPIAAARALKVQVDKGLLECDFGDWTGAELKKLMKLPEWRTVQQAPSTFTFPGGESFTAMQSRIVGAIDRLRAQHPGGVIVCVSHADPIKAAVAHAMGTHIDLFQRIVIGTCSITAIAYTAGPPIVLTVNSTGGSLTELRPS